jgi:hypothetical protein
LSGEGDGVLGIAISSSSGGVPGGVRGLKQGVSGGGEPGGVRGLSGIAAATCIEDLLAAPAAAPAKWISPLGDMSESEIDWSAHLIGGGFCACMLELDATD